MGSAARKYAKRAIVRDINGRKVKMTDQGWTVMNNTHPVHTRHYNGNSINYDKLECYNKKKDKFINVEFFSPVIYDLDNQMPRFNSRWEIFTGTGRSKKLVDITWPPSYKKWWKIQEDRCKEGYTVGGVYITGHHYWYLNFWRIKSKKRGAGYIPPRFLDIDKQFFDIIEQARSEGKNAMFLKRRQIGCSEKLAAMVAHEYTFYPGAESLIVAGLSEYSEHTTKKCRNGLNELSRYSDAKSGDAFYKRRLKDTLKFTQSGYLENGIEKGFRSTIHCITTKDNIQAASGKSPSLVVMEEAGRFSHLQVISAMIQESIEEGGSQGGRIMIYIGTGGEMDKGVAVMQKMFYSPETYNILSVPNVWDKDVDTETSKCGVFLPAWLYFVQDFDGNSYKEEGLEIISEVRKKKAGDKAQLHTYKTQMPLTPAEAFTASGLSPFNVIKLQEMRTKILTNRWEEKEQWGKLDWITNDKNVIIGVKWIAADDATKLDNDRDLMYPIMLLEHPERTDEMLAQPDIGERYFGAPTYINLYSGGTDPVDQDISLTSDSLQSCSMFKGVVPDRVTTSTSKMFVARITYRPSKKEKFYEMSAKLHAYYNAQNLIEWSNKGIFDWYKNNGWEYMLKERPTITYAEVKDSNAVNKYGVHPSTKQYWEDAYASYIEDNYFNMYDLEQVQRAIAYRRKGPDGKRYNCDITISSMLAYQNHLDNEHRNYKVIDASKKVKGKAWRAIGTVRSVNGRLKRA